MGNLADSPAVVALRIAAMVGRERLVPRMAESADDVPSSIERVTPAWWTAVLAGEVADAVVEDTDILSGSAGTHQRHRIALNWNDAGRAAGLPQTVFTKTLPTVVTRMIGGYNGTARAEGLFYTRLRSSLDIESPLGYHAAFDRRTYAGINVIEDIVASRDASFCGHRTVVTRAMADSMVDQLARLHARWYGDESLARDHRWVANFADWYRIGARKMRTEHYTRQAVRQLADELPARLVDRIDEIWPCTDAAAAVHTDEPGGLLHSDVHIGNWYQAGNGTMGLCDWQCVARGHGSRDLAYMLSSALTIADRRAWENELVARYLDAFDGYAGVTTDRDAFRGHYRRQMLHAFWMWTITLCHSPLLPAMQPEDTARELVLRIGHALDDLDCLDA